MNLHDLLLAREQDGKPIRVGVIGAGRFGTMFLAQVRATPGVHVAAVADIDLDRAHRALKLVDWPQEAVVTDLADALSSDRTAVLPEASQLFTPDIDVVVEATGNPIAGTSHALKAIETGQHIVMVTVEADALLGPALARRAADRGLVYSLAYGDQPALIMELVDWARTSGFQVVCAGKGAKYLEHYHEMNPDNVWENWEFSKELTDSGQLNPYMHTAFRDGTKAAIEMAAVANAAGLVPSDDGLTFTPGDVEEIATICRPRESGGVLAHEGSVDVMSSVTRDGDWIPHNTQEGVFVVVKATNDYVSGCFAEYPWHPDPTKQYAALYRPYHYVGLELGITIANAVLRGVPTGAPKGFFGDVVATAKKDLKAGDELDGEGGYTVWGKLISARASVERGALPIALAHHVKLRRDIPKGAVLTRDDVELDDSFAQVLELRAEAEQLLARD
ncbi:Gfo/Idh/MocA family oxidoreductase [Saccharopolyspora hirsuta]|uniref:Putative homoserine dehydrogenase-like protein n=1 Tax=Saccharopolyspora hordei TaxID=1838 RepID=A0A853AHV5_9PSEU|nr:putative homoserine dehydrogenase-like protein [Saccharopolyspora hordei]